MTVGLNMKTWFIILLVALVLVAGGLIVLLFLRKRLSTEENSPQKLIAENDTDTALTIKFEDLPALTEIEATSLVEIKDKQVLARIDNAIPGALQAVANTGAAKNFQQAAKKGGQLYQAVIPKGAHLAKSRETEGAFRGIYHGRKGIKGHADLIPVDGDMGKNLAAMNVANAAMGVAAMVVSQYYMTQINDQLCEINQEVSKISSFQDTEFLGSILSIIATVQTCSQFKLEIVDNENQRNRELNRLMRLEDECTKLLGQANLSLKEFEKKTVFEFPEYEKQVAEAEKWHQYQQILIKLLLQIEELVFSLSLGEISKDYCYAKILPYLRQTDEALSSVKEWHQKNSETFKIDLESSRRRRQGIGGLLMNIPALFNDNLHYQTVSGSTVAMISSQSSGQSVLASGDEPDLFSEDVRLIAKDGKLYYLPRKIVDDSNTSEKNKQ